MSQENGKGRLDDRVRVALVGVGNCANSLLQGAEYYKDAPDDQFVPGLMHVNLGGYHIRDIEFTAAFDVTADKVGKDLSDAMWAKPNDTIKFADVPKTGITVSRGMTHDGLGKYISEVVTKAPGETDDVVRILQDTQTDVVVNYLPVGSDAATKWYAEQVLEAGCAMVNCMPVFIAREAYWQRRFEEKGLPIIGDDIKSQVGVHPDGGLVLRRRAAQPGAEARGLGLAQLGRDRHRRRPPREAGPEQRRCRRTRGPQLVSDEVTAEAGARRRGLRRGGEVH